MDFVWGPLKVIIGGFLLFTVARVSFERLVPKSGWVWVVFVAILALANMLVHRWIGSTINPPFYTSILFAITLMGLTPEKTIREGQSSENSRWLKRGTVAVVVGTAIGWLSFATLYQP